MYKLNICLSAFSLTATATAVWLVVLCWLVPACSSEARTPLALLSTEPGSPARPAASTTLSLNIDTDTLGSH